MNKFSIIIFFHALFICDIFANEVKGFHVDRHKDWDAAIFSEVVINEELIDNLHPDNSIDEIIFGFDLEYVNFGVKDLRRIAELFPNVKTVRFASQNLCAEHLIFLKKLGKLENLTISGTFPVLALAKPFAGLETLGPVEGFILSECENLRNIFIKMPRDKVFDSYLRDDQKLFIYEDEIPIEAKKRAQFNREPEK